MLHLGGPDTITAFSLEDNALWLRHFLEFIFQVVVVLYIFLQSFPSNKLLVPTILMFVSGVIKYVERTRALYLASEDQFRKTIPREAYGDLSPADKEKFFAEISDEKNLDNDILKVKHAYHFFEVSKGALVDLVLSSSVLTRSREYFKNSTPEDALRVIAVELNFMYRVLYTKVVVVRSKLGYVLRFVSFSAVVISLFLFMNSLEKHSSFHTNIDVRITYTLLYGAIFLDAIAFFMLIFSDWTVATPTVQSKIGTLMAIILGKYLKLGRPNWSHPPEQQYSSNFVDWGRRLLFCRWSESVSCFNMIDYCLKENPGTGTSCICSFDKVIDVLGLKDFRDRLKYVSTKPLSKELWDFIFQELNKYTEDIEIAKRVSSARGAFALQSSEWKDHCSNLLRAFVAGVDFDQSVLLWHIATEICYNTENNYVDDNNRSRELSKILSDYMLYLLILQPALMTSIAGVGQTRFQETCEDAKNIFSKRWIKHDREANQEMACSEILKVSKNYEGEVQSTDKSALLAGCMLAKELDDKLKERKWKLMSEVWVELMAYAAGHCGPKRHAQVLSRGGELLSYVWLLMVHFGMAGHFQTGTPISLSSIDPHLGMQQPTRSQPFDLPDPLLWTFYAFTTPDPDPPSLPTTPLY